MTAVPLHALMYILEIDRMNTPDVATVKKWALRSAGVLLALALSLWIVFGFITYREEEESLRAGEPYVAITSSYVVLAMGGVYAGFGAAAAMVIYAGARFASKFRK